MKVCHILSGDLWGGAEVQTVHLLHALAAGEAVRVEAILFNRGETARRLEEAGVPVRVAEEKDRPFPALVSSVRKALRAAAPDVVHGHGYKENLVALVARRGIEPPIRTVRTQHSTPFPETTLRMRFYAMLDRRAARRFDRTVAVSGAVRAELERFLPASRIVSIDNGIPFPPPVPPEGWALPPEEGRFTIGTVGRLAPEKNHRLLIEMLPRLDERGIRADLVLVGEGPERERLERFAEATVPGRVRFAGFRRDVPAWLASFDVYALPSKREGLPLTLLEALALARPVVAAAVGGIPEVIRHGENGLLVPPGDVEALSEAVASLCRDRVRARELGEEGRRDVRSRFSIERVARRTETLYEEVVAEGRSGSE